MKIGTIRCIPSKNQFSLLRIDPSQLTGDRVPNLHGTGEENSFPIQYLTRIRELAQGIRQEWLCRRSTARIASAIWSPSPAARWLKYAGQYGPHSFNGCPFGWFPAGWSRRGVPCRARPRRIDRPSHFMSSARPGYSCRVESKFDSLPRPWTFPDAHKFPPQNDLAAQNMIRDRHTS